MLFFDNIHTDLNGPDRTSTGPDVVKITFDYLVSEAQINASDPNDQKWCHYSQLLGFYGHGNRLIGTTIKAGCKACESLGSKWLEEIFPSRISTKLRSRQHRSKPEKQLFLLLWPSAKIFPCCLPSKSVYLSFWPVASRRKGSAENSQMTCASPGSDGLIWPRLVHGGNSVMIITWNCLSSASPLPSSPAAGFVITSYTHKTRKPTRSKLSEPMLIPPRHPLLRLPEHQLIMHARVSRVSCHKSLQINCLTRGCLPDDCVKKSDLMWHKQLDWVLSLRLCSSQFSDVEHENCALYIIQVLFLGWSTFPLISRINGSSTQQWKCQQHNKGFCWNSATVEATSRKPITTPGQASRQLIVFLCPGWQK